MAKNVKICVIDYGVGNIFSVVKALNKFKANVILSSNKKDIINSDGLVLPGVGSFRSGMEGLRARGLEAVIRKSAKMGKPILGICLGAQLLLEKGYEFGRTKGLGIISGEVKSFPKLKEAKIPHIGWNKIVLRKEKETILKGLGSLPFFYFVHSYVLNPEKGAILSETEYGGYEFCSSMRKGNVYGFQFHPEKSGEVGLKIINNFVSLAKNVKN